MSMRVQGNREHGSAGNRQRADLEHAECRISEYEEVRIHMKKTVQVEPESLR